MQTKDRNGLKDNPVGEGYGFNFKKSSDEDFLWCISAECVWRVKKGWRKVC